MRSIQAALAPPQHRKRNWSRRARLATVLGVLLSFAAAVPAGGASAERTTSLISVPSGVIDPPNATATFVASSEDGSRVFFTTAGRLTPDDAESNQFDVYERAEGTTTLISQASGIADPGNASVIFQAASSDGSRVFFSTYQRLTAADNDTARKDVYGRAGGVTTLVSQPTGVADPDTANVEWGGISKDGTRAFFTSSQKLTPDDTDTNQADLYERSGGTTKLVSAPTGVADPDTAGAVFSGSSADGSRVFFSTPQKLTPDDTDAGRWDVYERSAGTTTLVSTGGGAPLPTDHATFIGASRDGTRVLFYSNQRLSPDDTDTGRYDVYERAGGATSLLSAPTGINDPDSGDMGGVRISQDGARVFFTTPQRLTPDDTDSGRMDVYERSGGTTTLASAPTGVADPNTAGVEIRAASADGSRLVFTTTQQLTPDDTDSGRMDVYERAGRTTTLLSQPTGVADHDTADVEFAGLSRDGSHVFMRTAQRLAADDADTNRSDAYVRSDGATTLVSKPTGVADPDTGGVDFGGNSTDGTVAFFSTDQPLVAEDGDPHYDLYAARTVSEAPAPGAGGETPGTSGERPAVDVTPVRLSHMRLSPATFRARPKGASVARRRPVGTRVSYRLSEPATVTFTIERALRGRPVRYLTLRGRLRHHGNAGANSFRFKGTLHGHRLGPGTFRLRARAVDAAGNASPVASKRFRIVRG
jgi:WD40-like Beta Propeller Repeat